MTTTATKERKVKADVVRISAQAFKRAVTIASHAVAAAVAKPALSCVRIGDGLVSGTDLEHRIDVDLSEATFSPVLLPAKRLRAILNEAAGDEVAITIDGSQCVIKIGRGEWRLPTEDQAEFPVWEPTGLDPMPAIPGDQFERAVKSVVYAIDKNSSRYALGGVLLEAIDNKLHFVATDGRRLSVATCIHDIATDDFVRKPTDKKQKRAPIVPVKPLTELLKHCRPNESVFLKFGNGTLMANVADVTITATTVQGEFPNWADIIPDKLPAGNRLIRDELNNAVRAASVVVSEMSRGVKFSFHGDTLTMKAKSADAGESKVECEIEEHGANAVVLLDPSYVKQFLRPFDKDDEPLVSIHVEPSDGKTILKVGDSCVGVIMPLAE